MAKYSYELKKKVVEDYLTGLGGYRYLRRKYGISSPEIVRTWIRTYDKYGFEGLRKKKNAKHTLDFKLNIVELYLAGNHSLTDLGNKYGVMNLGTIRNWVRTYETFGPAGFIPKKKGAKPDMKKLKSKMKDENKDEYIKRLEEEQKRLKLENELLKQLRGLRLAEEEQKKKQE